MIDRQTRDAYVARDAALRAWLTANKRNSYRSEELPAELSPTLTNEQRADVEVFDWLDNPPDTYFAYIQGRGAIGHWVTNWTGRQLARIVWRGDSYKGPLGDKRFNFRAVGTNGKVYAGTAYVSSGEYVRLRAVKPRKGEQ